MCRLVQSLQSQLIIPLSSPFLLSFRYVRHGCHFLAVPILDRLKPLIFLRFRVVRHVWHVRHGTFLLLRAQARCFHVLSGNIYCQRYFFYFFYRVIFSGRTTCQRANFGGSERHAIIFHLDETIVCRCKQRHADAPGTTDCPPDGHPLVSVLIVFRQDLVVPFCPC